VTGDFPLERRYLARAALNQSDEALEGECQLSFFVAGGPGGQHRNKTASAVRLVHLPTGLVVTAVERRSQAQNRVMALVRLREKLYALTRVPKVRKPTKPSRAEKARRLDSKRRTADKKRDRRRFDD
jgi:ribosome-associated protein